MVSVRSGNINRRFSNLSQEGSRRKRERHRNAEMPLKGEWTFTSQMNSAGPSGQCHSEKEISDAHMGDFDVETNRGWGLAMEMTKGKDPSALVLLRLAQVLSMVSNIRFPRDMRRRRGLIIKWIDDSFDSLVSCRAIVEIAVRSE
jgi:hypothetical protein